jgi:hypothetical protein
MTARTLAFAIAWRVAAVVGALWVTGELLGADASTGPLRGGVRRTVPVRNPQPDRARSVQGSGEAVAPATASSALTSQGA